MHERRSNANSGLPARHERVKALPHPLMDEQSLRDSGGCDEAGAELSVSVVGQAALCRAWKGRKSQLREIYRTA